MSHPDRNKPHQQSSSSSNEAHQFAPLCKRIAQRNPDFARKLDQMRIPLSPLVHIFSGQPHPDFPATMLHYWVLTDSQLEMMAHYYHQRTPGPFSGHYPCPIPWDSQWPLEEKRRQIGKFIGLPLCFTPVKSEADILAEIRRQALREEEESWQRGKMY